MSKKKENKLKEIELFDGKTLSDLFKDVFDRSTEEREKALEIYDNIAARFQTDDDVFMIGDKANPYLNVAQKATDNITKMLLTAQKMIEMTKVEEVEEGLNSEDILTQLDKLNANPEELEMRNNADSSEKNESFFDIDIEENIPKRTTSGNAAKKFEFDLGKDKDLERFK